MESVAERVADYLVGHHPGMPGLGKATQASTAARCFVPASHASTMPGPRRHGSRSRARCDAHAVPHRCQHPPHEGGGAAMGAGSSGGFAITRLPSGHTGRASRSGPRGRPFHGLDSVEDTRARHDAPSPYSPAPRPRRRLAFRGLRPRTPQACRQRQRGENPPRSTEEPGPAQIRKRLPNGSAVGPAIWDRNTVRCGPAVTPRCQRQEQLQPSRHAMPAACHGVVPPDQQ
jgi:hypothetical protein